MPLTHVLWLLQILCLVICVFWWCAWSSEHTPVIHDVLWMTHSLVTNLYKLLCNLLMYNCWCHLYSAAMFSLNHNISLHFRINPLVWYYHSIVFMYVSGTELLYVTPWSSQDLNCVYTNHAVMSLYLMPHNVYVPTSGWEVTVLFSYQWLSEMLHSVIHVLSLQEHTIQEIVLLLSIGSSHKICFFYCKYGGP